MIAEAGWAGPLAGIKVVDFTRVLAGPAAAQALADLGAEVWKIEPPGTGDETRGFPPHRNGESHYFLGNNRGKQSIVIDLKSPDGLQLARDLAAKADILVENYRPGVMDRLGLGYETLSAINPRLIYCAISGFGMTGPLRDRPSFDIVTQALSGVLSTNGEAGQLPVKVALPIGDLVGAINGPIGILAALYERERTGRGRLIDVGLLDGLLNLLGYIAQLSFFTGEDLTPQGSQHPYIVPYGAFPAKDGAIIIACLTNRFWLKICDALDLVEGRTDALAGAEGRRDHRAEVNAMIAERTGRMTMDELVERFTEYEVPHAPILGIQAALSQPQAVAREMVVEVEHSTLGRVPIVNRPIKWPGAEQPAPTAPPVLGEHTDRILADVLKLDAERIATLRASGAVA